MGLAQGFLQDVGLRGASAFLSIGNNHKREKHYERETKFSCGKRISGGQRSGSDGHGGQAAQGLEEILLHEARRVVIEDPRLPGLAVRSGERQIAALGHGAKFRRRWSFYLAYCEGGFRSGRIDVRQMLFHNPGARP